MGPSEAIEHDCVLIERGLKLHEAYGEAMEAQENAREAAEEAARARGEEAQFVQTDEERAWNEFHDRGLSGIAFQHKPVYDAFRLDPTRSALYEAFPDLLDSACDPQVPVLYDPSERQFALMETWGPAVRVIAHCPFTGRALPAALGDAWRQAVSDVLGSEDWSYDEAREKLPRDYWIEAWWIARGL